MLRAGVCNKLVTVILSNVHAKGFCNLFGISSLQNYARKLVHAPTFAHIFAPERKILWKEPWNYHKQYVQLQYTYQFQTKWLARSIDIIEKVENRLYYRSCPIICSLQPDNWDNILMMYNVSTKKILGGWKSVGR